MPDIDAQFERLSTEQVNAILDEQLSDDGSAESRSSQTVKYGASNNNKNDVERAFAELNRRSAG
jgi:hypothetical protein